MTPLFIAICIYVVGIATVLYVRPQLMFYAETGAWKEFGLDSGRTIMPFWMFALVWAILSYVAANLISLYFGGMALRDLPADVIEANIANVIKPVSKSPPPTLQTNVLASASATRGTTPGYYVLEAPVNGPPKYVYFGSEPPTLDNLAKN